MPSHISHALLIEELLSDVAEKNDADPLLCSIAADERARSIAVLGAQGPDIFLHNHHRKPRGFRYGALLHRRGNALLIESLAISAAAQDQAMTTATVAYAIGYLTHVHLDRVCHPYINWSAGWRDVPDRHPDRSAMHPFLERCIDSVFLQRKRSMGVSEFDFLGRLPQRGVDLFALRRTIITALQTALRSAGDDERIERRIANAFNDAYGFYRHTNLPNDAYFREARSRERRGTVHRRWLSVVHPRADLVTVDVLNEDARGWAHPCDSTITTDRGFKELYDEALSRSIAVVPLLLGVVRDPGEPHRAALREAIGPWNLNDGIATDPPCRRVYCDPLPLLELYAEIKSFYDA